MSEIPDTSIGMIETINVVEGIIFQANVLALNASVRASCICVLGHRFVVVA
jgi:methyl-accepting chemotaxis protein